MKRNLFGWSVALLWLLTGCAALLAPPPTPTAVPGPSPTPTPTFSIADLPLVKAAPETLVLDRGDLPAGFLLAGEEPEEGKIVRLFLRPAALEMEPMTSPNLLGVIASVAVHPDAPTAAVAYGQIGTSVSAITSDVREIAGEATAVQVQTQSVQLSGVDVLQAFRVSYLIGAVPLVEYRYIWLMENVIAGIIVTARVEAYDQEPSGLLLRAQTVAERQVSRIYRLTGQE